MPFTLAKKLVIALISGLLLIIAFPLAKQFFATPVFHGTPLPVPRAVAPFHFTGMDGKPFNQQRLQGEWTLVFFGFTHCSSVCPTTMTELARFMKRLERLHTQHLPRVVMISLDPEHDDLVQLKRFVTAFHSNFYAATGTPQAIADFSQPLGIAYSSLPNNSLEHSSTLVLFNPEGKIAAYFTPPHQAALLADDYRLLLTQHHRKGT